MSLPHPALPGRTPPALRPPRPPISTPEQQSARRHGGSQNADTERALLLLEEYCSKLHSPSERQLRLAIQKVIYMFKSNLFKALIDIQEFYEVTLLSSSIDQEEKISELTNIAELWEKNNSLSGGPESLQQASELEVLNGSNGYTSEEPNTENQPSDSSVAKKKKYRYQDEDTPPHDHHSLPRLTHDVKGPELVHVSEKNLSQIENVHGYVMQSHISPLKVLKWKLVWVTHHLARSQVLH